MQTRRQAALNVVLPHPPLSGPATALLSPNDGPHTPRSRALPTKLFSPNSNRKSSDSWNSSIHEDDFATEWKPEHILMLQRTLDALPSHLLTPFNGPVPPSNLLDKIARGVAEAKGPADWPHSQRATRAKIVELAQRRARDSTPIAGIAEEPGEEEDPCEVLKPSSRVNRRRTLYRQSSMDFIPDAEPSKKDNIKDNQSINRLSQRLQRNDRTILSSPFHPYARPSPSPKKSSSRSQLSSLNTSTPSSSTLNSSLFSNSPTKQPGLRRSFSSLSSSSDPATLYPDNPRVQKMKRADSFAAPAVTRSLKRAPSFGSDSNQSSLSDTMNVDANAAKEVPPTPDNSGNHPAKRSRKRSRPMPPTITTPAPTRTPARKSPVKPPVSTCKPTRDLRSLGLGSPMVISPVVHSSPAHNTRSATKLRANVRRNPSILGGELPFPQQTPPAPQPFAMSPPSSRMSIGDDDGRTMNISPSPVHKSLRRVKVTTFGMRPLARKISFGTIAEENCEPGTGGLGLGSAFQLR